jgi:spermidine synthase
MPENERTTELIEQRVEDDGSTLALHRRGEAYEVLRDGRRAIVSDARRSEASLAELALAPLRGRDDVTVVVAGLGMGFGVRAVLDAPGVKIARVDVVESSRAIVDWEARHFAALNGDALKDPRVSLHAVDLATFLKQARLGALPGAPEDGWFAVLLDLDDGPGGLWRPENAAFYTDEGIGRLEAALRPGGVLALWSPARETALMGRLHARLQNVAELLVPVEIEGRSSLDYIYRGRRHPPPPSKPAN